MHHSIMPRRRRFTRQGPRGCRPISPGGHLVSDDTR
jgi:hypothetical protein